MKKEVGGHELVQKFFRGSANIDRMREEIDHFVSVMQGCLGEEYSRNREMFIDRVIQHWGTSNGWQIKIHDPHIIPELQYVQPAVLGCGKTIMFSRHHKNAHDLKLAGVTFIYGELPKLAQLVKDTFPQIIESLQPLLDAADVFPPK